MTHVELTHERLLELLDYDPETGIFLWKIDRTRGIKAGDNAGSISTHKKTGYKSHSICLDSITYKAARLAVFYMTEEMPQKGMQVDHINHQTLDHRFVNIRLATVAQNAYNKHKTKVGVLPKGLVLTKQGRYRTQIWQDGKSKYLGTFVTMEEALSVREAAAKELHGEFYCPA